MTSKKKGIITALIIITAGAGAAAFLLKGDKREDYKIIEILPEKGTIKTYISSTGTVLPQNRLEIKPPVNGRIEKIFVNEGQKVYTGQVLTEISSTERAALLDAARSQGNKSLKYWEDAYKPILLIAPINGTVIVRSVEPGQTVITTLPVLVLSDMLIVKAMIDETDIGKIKVGLQSVIGLDAYPSVKVNGKVGQISFESKIVNNVTMYEVNIIPDTVPDVFRSGMSANVMIINETRENILMLPSGAIKGGADGYYVYVKTEDSKKPEKRGIQIGISDEKNTEVLSGLTENDTVVDKQKKFSPAGKGQQGINPFGQDRRRTR